MQSVILLRRNRELPDILHTFHPPLCAERKLRL